MFAIILIAAALLFALLGAAAKRTGVEGVPARKKPNSNTEPLGLGLELERSRERSSAPRIEHELDNSRSPKKDKRAKLTREDILNFQRLLHPEPHELEAKPKKKTRRETLRENLKDVKPPPRDLSSDRDRGRENRHALHSI
jgi:hypothetical protein